MKYTSFLLFLSMVLFTSQVVAGRTGFVNIGELTASNSGIEIEDNNSIADGCVRDLQWVLEKNHLNYKTLLSVLLMAKVSSKSADFIFRADAGCTDPIVEQIIVR